jgi:hypothetical protein
MGWKATFRLAVLALAGTALTLGQRLGNWSSPMTAQIVLVAVITAIALTLLWIGVDGLIWSFNRYISKYGRFERMCRRRMRVAEQLLQSTVSYEDYNEWKEATIRDLVLWFGLEVQHEEIERFEAAEIGGLDEKIADRPCNRAIRKHLTVLDDLIARNRERRLRLLPVRI